jgi:sugar-phosphatase
VLAAAGVAGAFAALVTADDVERGKPEPDGYMRAFALLGAEIHPADVLVFEDTEAGVASAKAAGARCLAVLGTLAPERLVAADEVVERIDVELMRRLLE